MACIYIFRTENEHVNAEKEKVLTDLNEAYSRIAILAQEGDERYSHLEKNRNQDLQ